MPYATGPRPTPNPSHNPHRRLTPHSVKEPPSTRSQKDDSQLDALTLAGCERIWTDTASGKLARRPEWDKCLDYLRAGDELVITRLSRMARSVRHLTEIAALLADRSAFGLVPRNATHRIVD